MLIYLQSSDLVQIYKNIKNIIVLFDIFFKKNIFILHNSLFSKKYLENKGRYAMVENEKICIKTFLAEFRLGTLMCGILISLSVK